VGYGYADLTQDDLSYTISGLQPGVSYTVYVSALNRHGQGARAAMESGGLTLPVMAPSPPTNVTVATKGYETTEGDGIGDSQVDMPTSFGIALFLARCDSCCCFPLVTTGGRGSLDARSARQQNFVTYAELSRPFAKIILEQHTPL